MPLRPTLPCLALACLLAACAPAIVAPPAQQQQQQQQQPDAAPAVKPADYAALRAQGQAVLDIVPQASLIAITVRRGGALARLGHDHVVASRAIEGFVAPVAGLADFHFRLDQMSVDEPGLRREAGLDTQPSEAAIEGTRDNMLVKVLDAATFPEVAVHAARDAAAAPDAPLTVSITLHGVTRTMAIPVSFERDAGGGLAVGGSVALNQSDFGLVPFSVMGGAMAVQDRMELRFRIVAAPR